MKKIRIIKNNKTYFESHFYPSYENEKIIEIDFNDLQYADLHRTDLYNADLSYADLYNADLSCAILCHADLSHADLSHADLTCANLSGADLHCTNLSYVNLQYAILDEEERIRKGKIINKKTFVYKKCQGKIVKLELQIGSIVFSINNKKCRTNKAKVISIDGNNKKGLQIESDYDNNFIYEVGKIVEVPNFNLMYNVECGTGIHFFWTEKEAKKYFS
nr:MAG TPA: pentapeptide repeat protein [Caudoviricetes sp.]DAS16929.1 MAG TPA: pentapeptide repeat protein [Caudoviricetes sp.]